MRALMIIGSACFAAACSGGGGEENKAAEAATGIAAGQWEVASEVTSFRSTDKALPALKAAVGDKATSTACVEKGDEDKPKAELFAGAGYECKYRDSYFSGGRINASLECERDALDGKVMMVVQGNSTGDAFEGKVDSTSYLPGEGDFAMSSKITARRTADACAPAAEDAKSKDKKKA